MAKSLKHLTAEEKVIRAARRFHSRLRRTYGSNVIHGPIESAEIVSGPEKGTNRYLIALKYADGLNWDLVEVTLYDNGRTRVVWA